MPQYENELENISNNLSLIISSPYSISVQGNNNTVTTSGDASGNIAENIDSLKKELDIIKSFIENNRDSVKDSVTFLGDLRRIFDELSKNLPKWDIVKVLIKSILDGIKSLESVPDLIVNTFKNIVEILSKV